MTRRSLALLALALGGWRCESADDNPCPGALTCPIDVATVCCPFEAPVWCNRCVVNDSACEKPGLTCDDEATIRACDFTATITDATCTSGDPSTDPVTWTIAATGTLTGCGQEVALVTVGRLDPVDVPVRPDDIACGTWTEGVFGGCVPPAAASSTTTFTIHRVDQLSPGQSHAHVIAVLRGHGAQVPLATSDVTCGP